MTILAIILAVAAIAYAFLTRRKLQEVSGRLSRTNSNLYELAAQVETLEDKLVEQRMELLLEIRKASGQLDIQPQTTIAELQAQHPFADHILADFHMGGCSSCSVSPDETISSACSRLDVNEAALLAALKNGNQESAIPLHNISLQI